ncbi:MAG: hypothetical protein IJK81_11060 [Selenomonadaceae bacterium]|nr:hypothetical protein [Selenomonadaceae bacterium]
MADNRSKKIKFALYLKNNEEVRSKSDFKKHFDMTAIIGYLFDGKLLQWMRVHDYPNATCRAVDELVKNYNRKTMLLKNLSPENEKIFTRKVTSEICKIFEIDESEIGGIESIEQIIKSSNKEYDIIQVAAFEDEGEEEEILQYVNQIVRTQEELDEVITRLKSQKKAGKYKIIYLLNKGTPYELHKEDVFDTSIRFVGINRQSSTKDVTKIRIVQTNYEGKIELLKEEEVKKPENRDKFSNLERVGKL